MPSFASDVVSLLVKEFGCGDADNACPKAQMLAAAIKDIIEDAVDGGMDMTKEVLIGPDEEEYDPSWFPDDEDMEDEIALGVDEFRFGDRIVDRKAVDEAIVHYRTGKQWMKQLFITAET